MKKLLLLPFITLTFIVLSCSSDYTTNKEKTEAHKEKIEKKGFGGVKTEPSRSTVVSDDSVAAENPTNKSMEDSRESQEDVINDTSLVQP